MSEVLDRRIKAARIGEPNGGGARNLVEQVSPMDRMFAWYDKRGLLGNALILRAILGREPRTPKAYIEQLAASTSTTGASR